MTGPDQPTPTAPASPPPYTGTAPQLYPTHPTYPVAQPRMPGPPAPQPWATPQGQPATPGGRLVAVLLDLLLFYVTVGIGWFIWSLVTWNRGQTPAGALMGHVVVDARTGLPFDRSRMVVRELLIKGGLGVMVGSLTGGIYNLIDGLMIFGNQRATLHDRIVGSLVYRR